MVCHHFNVVCRLCNIVTIIIIIIIQLRAVFFKFKVVFFFNSEFGKVVFFNQKEKNMNNNFHEHKWMCFDTGCGNSIPYRF